eukprot:TRINITY_DN3873_c1_g1_i4.p1 TRINITY_DN3873_c1_g1~~TRINITY_DN3873_c1_g1_i4.p1  ORF type:complete len:342 (-),score=59.44 TRINITY_DN3873_c1_g1_i4:706-1731(-)
MTIQLDASKNHKHNHPFRNPADKPASCHSVDAPLMEGTVHIKLHKGKWEKRTAILNSRSLYVFKSHNTNTEPLIISLFGSQVSIPESSKRKKFILNTIERRYKFYVDEQSDVLQWTNAIADVCQKIIVKEIENNATQGAMSHLKEELNADVVRSPGRRELLELLAIEGNNVCADCNAQAPEWASINLGVFICIQCSGCHRNLGTHISKVRSCLYDRVDADRLHFFKSMGNINANRLWEHSIPASFHKCQPSDSMDTRQHWIRSKYVDMSFIDPASKEEMLSTFNLGHVTPPVIGVNGVPLTQSPVFVLKDRRRHPFTLKKAKSEDLSSESRNGLRSFSSSK